MENELSDNRKTKVNIRNPLRYLQDHKESSRNRAPPYDMS